MKKKFILLTLVLLIGSFSLFLPCDKDLYCHGYFSEVMQYPFVWFLALVPLSLFALTLKDEKYKFWIKFTGISFIIGMFFVLISPETARGIMLNPDKELVNWFFAGLYTFISIIYFIVQFIKNRRK